MERAWILLGMMGAGKSALGRGVAELSGRPFVDTDILLQNRFGRPVSQIFQIYGEQTFRDHENSVLRGLEPGPYILATGGGIVTREENWNELRRIGTTIFLQASPETLIGRLEQSKKRRPLLETENWQERARGILESRLPLYLQADLVVRVDGLELDTAPQVVLDQIRRHEADRS
ncbi:MAG TPA: shikimate kinase [Fimbriimonas sp.]|nr:shikimate kinase [Fimbriimonas sp.]